MTATWPSNPITDGEAIASSLKDLGSFELVFDRHYGASSGYLERRAATFLGESLRPNRQVHAKAGTVLFESTYLASGIVQRIGQSLPR